MRGNGRLIRLGFAACRGDDFVGGVADFVDNHQIFRLCADVELVFHRVKFGVVAAPIDIKFGIVGAFTNRRWNTHLLSPCSKRRVPVGNGKAKIV